MAIHTQINHLDLEPWLILLRLSHYSLTKNRKTTEIIKEDVEFLSDLGLIHEFLYKIMCAILKAFLRFYYNF